METSSNLNFFKVVVVRLVFLTAIHFCLDRPGICTQLEEKSSSLLKKFTWQICFAKQTFIHISLCLCRRAMTTRSRCYFFSLPRARVSRGCVCCRFTRPRAHVSFSRDSWVRVSLCISSQVISVSSTRTNIFSKHLFLFLQMQGRLRSENIYPP